MRKRFFIILIILLACLQVPFAVVASNTITLNHISSKTSGSVVTIGGQTSLSEVNIKVLRPNNTVLYVDIVNPAGGVYSTGFQLPSDAVWGNYTVVVGMGRYVATETFTVGDTETPTPPPPSETPETPETADTSETPTTLPADNPTGSPSSGGSDGVSSTSNSSLLKTDATVIIPEDTAPKDIPPPIQEANAGGALRDIINHWAEDTIKVMITQGVAQSYPDGCFKPDNKISRAEFAVFLVRAFQLECESGKVFCDTAKHWAKDAIATAAAHEIVEGYDAGTFGPDDLLNREQMALMIVRAAELKPVSSELFFTDSNNISEWARGALASATENGIMTGYPDNTVRPGSRATRAEALTVIFKAIK